MGKLSVYEIFTSIEGEGPQAGTPTLFIRVAGCDFRCPFCDTSHSWEVKAGTMHDVKRVAVEAMRHLKRHPELQRVSITGGNPLLYKNELQELFLELDDLGHELRHSNGTPRKIMFNIEHPGLLMQPGWEQALLSEREFLYKLGDFVRTGHHHLSINTDVKVPLWEDVHAAIVAHHGLAGALISLAMANPLISASMKVLISEPSHLRALEAFSANIIPIYTHTPNFSWWVGLVRNKENKVDENLAKETINALCSLPAHLEWRVNPNTHILLGIR